MNLSNEPLSLNSLASTNKAPLNSYKMRVVLGVVLAAMCTTVQCAEIHEAAELGNFAKVKACLAQDPKQINTLDGKGRTVLARAALSAKKEIVEFLHEKGAPEDIFTAAIVGHTNKVAAFLQEDPKRVNAKDTNGKAALHYAAMYGQKQILQLLLAANAEVNMVDDVGFTALHWAAMFNKSEVAEVLLAHKADMNIKVPKFAWTPLRLTVIHGHLATAETLFKAGADPNDRDEENIPLLIQAVIRGNKAMVELLLAKKADVNAIDWDGDRPLDEAVEYDNKELFELLRRHGGLRRTAR
jgi:ankyrin repeat protein